jgi:DNA polymerase-3 subunit delta'
MFVNMDEDTRSSEIDKNTSDKTQKKSPDWIKTRQWLILETSHLITDKHKNNTANSATAIAMAEKIGNQSDYIDETIFILKTWLRDMLVFKYCPDKIINRDFLPFLKDIADNVGIKEIILWFKTLNDAENRIRSNSSVRLSLECFFLKLIFPSTV